jgi:hypothetical protein
VSTTDHGPSNHEDDLGRALRDLVDDASLPGLDTHLDVVRGRTRRRRAAKKVALGATTLCVAGALGIAAVSLPHDARPEPIAPARSPSPSATQSPTPASLPTFPTPLTAQALECQQPAPTPTGDQLPARLGIDASGLTVQNLELVDTTVTTTYTDDARITLAGERWSGAYVVVQDGVIVSSLLPLPETDGPLAPEPGSSVTREMSVDSFASCDPEGLNDHSPSMLPGDYQVYALSRFQLDSWAPVGPDGTVGQETTGALYDGWIVSEPVPLTVVPEPDPVTPGAFASPTVSFPPGARGTDLQCLAPMPAPTGPEMLARLTFDQPRLTLRRGSSVSVGTTFSAVPDARVTYRDFTPTGGWAIAKDGLVVAYSLLSADTSFLVDLDESSAKHTVTETRGFSCTASDFTPDDVLPPGTYDLYGVELYAMTSYSLRTLDGTWGPVNEIAHSASLDKFVDAIVVSRPIPLTIE